jgi:iron complex transport system permease protein
VGAWDIYIQGDVFAFSRGVEPGEVFRRGLYLVAILEAVCLVVAGPLPFISLVVPHFARLLVGPGHEAMLKMSGVGGATLLVMADLIGRTCFLPMEIEAGVITALIGAPCLLVRLWQQYARVA